jgi:hypothetical protein
LLAVESELLEVRFEHEACAGNEARWQRRLLDWQVCAQMGLRTD